MLLHSLLSDLYSGISHTSHPWKNSKVKLPRLTQSLRQLLSKHVCWSLNWCTSSCLLTSIWKSESCATTSIKQGAGKKNFFLSDLTLDNYSIQIFRLIPTVGTRHGKYLQRCAVIMRLHHQIGTQEQDSASCFATGSCARPNSLSSSSPLSKAQSITTQMFPTPGSVRRKKNLCVHVRC